MTEPDQQLHRSLRNRHIQLIALGGAIGTGLFYGAADSIAAAGPAVIVSYLIGGVVIYLIMRALGEMSVHNPTSGAFSEYAHQWWGDLPGFISGWNYWFNYIFVSMAELSVVGIYINYWFPVVPRWVSAAVLLAIVTTVNLLHVRAYGEVEFWFAIIKVVAIIAMIVLGLWIIFFGTGSTPATGIGNLWRNGGFLPHGVTGMLAGIIVVMFSFGGTELIGITAGEAEDPQRSIPRAINRVVPRWVSAAVLLAIVTTVNLLHVRAYGEVEFWFAIIKVVAIIAMIVLGLWIIFFGTGSTPATGIGNLWRNGGFLPHGVTGMLAGIIVVMFSFGGTELIGITAGEAEDPQRSIPRAINRVVGRILLFYVGALIVMVAIVPWTKIDGNASPFVQIFDLVGIPGAAAILNLVVLTAAISAYNSGLYANGRMLHALAHQGDAPAFLGKVNKAGSPWAGVLLSSAVTAIAVVVVGLLPEQAFVYIMSIAMIAAIINWATIIITQMLFRRRLDPESRSELRFTMPGAPVTNWIVLAFLVLMVVVMTTMPPYRIAVAIGPIWLAVLGLGWQLSRRRQTL